MIKKKTENSTTKIFLQIMGKISLSIARYQGFYPIANVLNKS